MVSGKEYYHLMIFTKSSDKILYILSQVII
jgi:hypothetical protein